MRGNIFTSKTHGKRDWTASIPNRYGEQQHPRLIFDESDRELVKKSQHDSLVFLSPSVIVLLNEFWPIMEVLQIS